MAACTQCAFFPLIFLPLITTSLGLQMETCLLANSDTLASYLINTVHVKKNNNNEF